LAPGSCRSIVNKFSKDFADSVKEVAILGAGYIGLFSAMFLAEEG